MIESEPEVTDIVQLSAHLLARAAASKAKRAAATVHNAGGELRQTIIALPADSELAEHESPPEATLQVIEGKIRLNGKDRHWVLTKGQLVQIPPERHSVTALADSAFLLTVRNKA